MSKKKPRPPVPSDFTFEHKGQPLAYSKYTSKTTGQVTAILVERVEFPNCPICLTPGPDVAEHVPPASLNGQVMTLTCRRCNHDFGTAEDHLRRLIDLETTVQAIATDGSVQGRRAAKVALRSAQGRGPGAFVRSAAPDFHKILDSGSAEVTISPVDMTLAMAAALKHAYLASCLHLETVPESDDVDRVRSALLAARDRDPEALQTALAEVTTLGFSYIEAVSSPPVLLLEMQDDDPHWLILLGGRFAVPWPFTDVQPRAPRS